MTKVFKPLPHLLLLALTCGILTSCMDVDKTLGVDMLPDDEQHLLVTDTIYPDAFTMSMDSVNVNSSSVNFSSEILVGSHFDPMFGLTSAGCTFQLLPIVDSTNFGTGLHLDSLVLQLVVNRREKNGNNAPQTIAVYEQKDRISFYSKYYPITNAANMAESTPVATYSYDGKADTVRIRLSQTLGNKLLSASQSTMILGDSLDKSPFLDYMKGFYITATSASGSERMNYFSPLVSMTLYYDNSIKADTTCTYSSLIKSNGIFTVLFNTTKHDYSQASAAQKMRHLNDTTATGLDSVLYAEGFYGATPYVKLSAAKLKDWLQKVNLTASQASIVRAELVMEVQEFSGFDMTKYPASLGAMTMLNPIPIASSNGAVSYAGFLSSFYNSRVSTKTSKGDEKWPDFDGTLNGTRKKYSFTLTNELLTQLRKGGNISFYLAPYTSNGATPTTGLIYYLSPNQQTSYKAVLKGPKNSKPLKLIITYAKPK